MKRVPEFQFGEEIVLCEPSWYQFWESPYYTDSHRAFRAKVRKFVDDEILPNVDAWEETYISTGREMPLDFIKKAYAAGIYSPQWSVELGGTPPQGGFDAFHDLILNDEISRSSCAGVASAFTIYTMAIPPILHSKNKYLIESVVKPVIRGEKLIALCISEPYAGSDVANIRATAKKDGDYYVINGEKKWITMGCFADFFTVAARTGGEGAGGLSLFVVPRNTPGVTVTRMKLQGSWLSGTSLVIFNDVKIPAQHLVGMENTGFKQVMHNFNHERYVIAVQANRGSRAMLSESIRYALKRKTFGKRLLEHQVIRQKLADMAMRVEACHALIEQITYQMFRKMPEHLIGGSMALLKVFATRTLELCAREASQIFGGSSYVRGGVGMRVERSFRDVRGVCVPGGSDEILADLAIRQSITLTQKAHLSKSKL